MTIECPKCQTDNISKSKISKEKAKSSLKSVYELFDDIQLFWRIDMGNIG